MRPPQTATEFADYFKNSKLAELNRREIEEYKSEFVGKPDRALAFKQSARAEIAKGSRKGRCVHYFRWLSYVGRSNT